MATIIDRETAKKLIAEYKEQNTAASGPALKTPDGKNLEGFFLDRETIETILKEPGVVGISLMLSKHPQAVGSNVNTFSPILSGAKIAAQPSSTPYENDTDLHSNVPVCPPFCVSI